MPYAVIVKLGNANRQPYARVPDIESAEKLQIAAIERKYGAFAPVEIVYEESVREASGSDRGGPPRQGRPARQAS